MSIKIGDIFGRLSVTGINGSDIVCRCECGKERTFKSWALRRSNNKSCGCLNHGMTGTRIYVAWTNMKRRCNDPANKSYESYGGRGISYDERWEEFDSFYEDMKNGYSDELTLDRIDVDGDYSKDNCRWSDFGTQMNNMTTNKLVEYEGKKYTQADFARKHNLDYELFRHRIQKGWTVEESMKPVEREEITYNGITKTVTEWAEEKGMTYYQLKKRLMRGWTVERAIEQPLRKRR